MRKILIIACVVAIVAAAAVALAGEPANFGGNGAAWEEKELGGTTYYDHKSDKPLSKDWETPAGEKRFTNPGQAEGHASENSAIQEYPCPGTQVYPGSN